MYKRKRSLSNIPPLINNTNSMVEITLKKRRIERYGLLFAVILKKMLN